MKEDFQAMWSAFVESVVRFFNNRFQTENETYTFLQNELIRARQDYKELVESVLHPPVVNVEQEVEHEFKPITNNFEPFHIKRARLERASRIRAEELRSEAAVAVERTKSTEQLEDELGIG